MALTKLCCLSFGGSTTVVKLSIGCRGGSKMLCVLSGFFSPSPKVEQSPRCSSNFRVVSSLSSADSWKYSIVVCCFPAQKCPHSVRIRISGLGTLVHFLLSGFRLFRPRSSRWFHFLACYHAFPFRFLYLSHRYRC